MFGKKVKMTADEIIDLLSELSQDELEKIKSSLLQEDSSDEASEDESVAETTETSETDVQEKNDNPQEESATDVEEAADTEAVEDSEAKTEGGEEQDYGALMELVTKLDARITALEKADEQHADEEIGTDSDFVDEVNPQMPASYMEQAKKMRY